MKYNGFIFYNRRVLKKSRKRLVKDILALKYFEPISESRFPQLNQAMVGMVDAEIRLMFDRMKVLNKLEEEISK